MNLCDLSKEIKNKILEELPFEVLEKLPLSNKTFWSIYCEYRQVKWNKFVDWKRKLFPSYSLKTSNTIYIYTPSDLAYQEPCMCLVEPNQKFVVVPYRSGYFLQKEDQPIDWSQWTTTYNVRLEYKFFHGTYWDGEVKRSHKEASDLNSLLQTISKSNHSFTETKKMYREIEKDRENLLKIFNNFPLLIITNKAVKSKNIVLRNGSKISECVAAWDIHDKNTLELIGVALLQKEYGCLYGDIMAVADFRDCNDNLIALGQFDYGDIPNDDIEPKYQDYTDFLII